MAVSKFEDLLSHVGHDVVCVTYGKDGVVDNVALECADCGEVLVDFDHPLSKDIGQKTKKKGKK